ncbi:uncharacterized protein Dana_GF17680 [Drosophila ananassae]|uniref:Solute carrier family 25 member 40 n=1 Tax=Drosophila ananassae TaxID=7217 RepID=B3LYY0_DROAN|nr:solute carrier family 25 member 40 [Drosophila ananassae]EDV41854.1 uncharacterized protein Dana_GF17680 [Drosophila ananassae]
MSKKDKGATGAETNTSDTWVSVGSKTVVFPQSERSPTGDRGAGGERSGLSNSYRGIGDLEHAVGKHRKLLSDPRFRIRPLQQVLSACAGAMITACFMTPLDVIKTRMQLQHSSSNKCFFYSNGLMDHLFPCGSDGAPNILRRRQKPQFTSTRDALIKISRHEGIWTLWSGLGPTLVSALPSTIIYFVAYEQFKAKYVKLYQKHFKKKSQSGSSLAVKDEALPAVVPMMSGVTARVSAVTVVSPIELVRTKMQAQRQSYAQMLQFVRNVIALQGIWGLWRGLRPTILRDVPFSGIYWPIYEYLKRNLGGSSSQPSFGLSFVAGVLAGSVAAIVTTPFDVVKTLEQIEFGERVIFTDSPAKDVGRRSTFRRLATVYKMHGVRGLFAGIGPRLLKVAPACAIMISTFEYSKCFFFYYNVKRHNEALLLSNPNATLVKEDDIE